MAAVAHERSVPLARRQLGAERVKLVLAVIGVALAVALSQLRSAVVSSTSSSWTF